MHNKKAGSSNHTVSADNPPERERVVRNSTYQDRTFNDILIAENLISSQKLAQVLGERENTTEPIGDMLVRLGLITEKDKARCLGKQNGISYADLAHRELDPRIARLIPHALALKHMIIPVARTDAGLSMAMVNPLDITAIDEVQAQTNLPVEPMIATASEIREAIARTFGAYDDLTDLVGEAARAIDSPDAPGDDDRRGGELTLAQLRQMSEGAPVVRLVNALVTRAVACRASDIHLNLEKNRVSIRYRVDGLLQEAMVLPKELQYPLISRLKIMASMDIAERRAPQDGRITMQIQQNEYDFRASTYPAIHGENMVIRILDKDGSRITLDSIGIAPDILGRIKDLIKRPHGMIMVCGPTGSGKTTTVYACLNALNNIDRNIMTIEDPVELQVPGIVQGNVNVKAGLTFATGLRTLVRQDPDIILVGEIRDTETARIALEAALTGHLVLSTIHANDAAGAVTRLIDLGVEPFLIASAVVATVAQRLVRLTCPRCQETYTPETALLEELECADLLGDPSFQFRRGAGCEACNKVGFKGRTGVHELMEVDRDIQRLILERASTQEIKAMARRGGRRTLRDDGVLRVRQGITTPEEVARMTTSG
jgi:type IV pilus assembly protein PilB